MFLPTGGDSYKRVNFSVLGNCMLEPVETNDSIEVEKTPCEAQEVIKVRKMNIVDHHAWIKHFERKGDHLEHVAILTLRLSRFVFPSQSFHHV